MGDDIQWAIGIGLSLFIALATTVRAMFVNLSAKLAKTHERIDDVKDKYVRRDDLDARLEPITRQLADINRELRALNDNVISAAAALKSSDK